jgi:general secretion pathway protein G
MNHPTTHQNSRETGFTLIELLITIVVLGILAAVVIFALGGLSEKTATTVLQKDYAIIGVHKVADAAEVLGEAAGNASLAPALILDRNQLLMPAH